VRFSFSLSLHIFSLLFPIFLFLSLSTIECTRKSFVLKKQRKSFVRVLFVQHLFWNKFFLTKFTFILFKQKHKLIFLFKKSKWIILTTSYPSSTRCVEKNSSKITTRVQTTRKHKLSITQAKQKVLAPIKKLIWESCKFCLMPHKKKA